MKENADWIYACNAKTKLKFQETSMYANTVDALLKVKILC